MSRSRVPSRSPLRTPLGAHWGEILHRIDCGQVRWVHRCLVQHRQCRFAHKPKRRPLQPERSLSAGYAADACLVRCAHWAEGVSTQKCPKCIYCWPFPRYRAVPHGLTTTAQLKNVKGVGTAHPPGAHFLVMPQESGERTALRGDAECHAPACQAALP